MSEPLNDDKNSLLDELETIHKRINEESDRPDSGGLGKAAVSRVESTQNEHKRHSMFSGLLGKRDKNSSLPLFAGSSSHQGLLATNSGEDMNFVMGLSENLLLECRKLQVEIEGKSRSIDNLRQNCEQLQDEHDHLKKDFDEQSYARSQTLAELELVQNSKSHLELELKDMSVEIGKLKEKLNEKTEVIKDQSLNIETLRQGMKAQIADLRKEIDVMKEEHIKELTRKDAVIEEQSLNIGTLNTKTQITDLNKEIDVLKKEHINELNRKDAVIEEQSINTNIIQQDTKRQIADLRNELDLLKENHVAELENEKKTANIVDVGASVKETTEYLQLERKLEEAQKEIDHLTQELTDATNNSSYDDNDAFFKAGTDKDENIHRDLPFLNALEVGTIVALPNDNSSEKVNDDLLSNESMIGKLESVGYKVISSPAYNEMQKEMSEFIQQSKRPELTLTEMQNKLKNSGYFVYDNAAHEVLQASIERPDMEHIRKALERIGMTMVPKESSNKISIIEKSKKDTVVPMDKYHELQRRFTAPSKSDLERDSEKLGLTILSSTELDEMKSLINTPPLEFHEKKLANIGYSVIKSDEYEELKTKASTSGLENLTKMAKMYDCVLVKITDICQSGIYDVEALKNMGEDGKFVLLEESSYHAMLNGDSNKINKREVLKLCSKFDLVPLASKKYEELTKPPGIDKIEAYAAQNASVIITRENYDTLKSEADYPTEEAVKGFAEQNGLSMVNKNEYHTMIDKLDNPSKHYLEKQAGKLGLAVISIDKYDSLLKEINDKSVPTTPSNASKVLASKQYFEEVIRNENGKPEKILESTKILGFVTLSNDEYKTLKDNQKERVMTKSDIYHGAKIYDLTVIPNDEYRALLKRKSHGDSLEFGDLEMMAARFDMQIVPLNIKDSESPTPRRVKTIDNGVGTDMTFVNKDSSDHFTSMETNGKINDVSQGKLIRTEGSLELVGVENSWESSQNETESVSGTVLDHCTSVDSPPDAEKLENLRKHAECMGYHLSLISDEQNRDTVKDSPSLTSPGPSLNSNHVLGNVDKERIEALASKLGFLLVSKAEYDEFSECAILRKNVENGIFKTGTVISSTETIGDVNDSAVLDERCLRAKASEWHFKLFSEVEFKSFQCELERDLMTLDNIKNRAHELGYVLIMKERFDQLENIEKTNNMGDNGENDESNNSLLVKSDTSTLNMGLQKSEKVNSSNDSSVEGTQDGSCILAKSETGHQEAYTLTANQIIEQAKQHSLVVLSAEEYEMLKNYSNIDKQQIMNCAKVQGLVVLNETHYDDLKSYSNMTIDQVIDRAQQYDLVPLKTKDYDALKESSATSKKQIVKAAENYNMVVLDKDQYDNLRFHTQMTREQIISFARRYDLVAINSQDYKNLKTPKALSIELLRKEAQDKGMVVVSRKDFNELNSGTQNRELNQIRSKSGSMNIATKNFDTEEHFKEFIDVALKNGTLKSENGKALSRPTNLKDVVLLPRSYYQELTAVKTNGDDQQHILLQSRNDRLNSRRSLQQKRPKTQRLESLEVKTEGEAKRGLVQTSPQSVNDGWETLQPQSPVSGGTSMKRTLRKQYIPHNSGLMPEHSEGSEFLDNISLTSIASLKDSTIIPVLTQTVIGEYLFKYHRFLGMESRHERFFWIHPYTLTLYWSTTNPILDSKSNSQRTKSATILGVESVPDSNPYPAGLYHKSLIIASAHKTIKITCPTRRRHNVWFNSLRYLLQKSSKGTNLQEVANDSTDDMYTGKVFPLPNNASNLSSSTFSSFNRLPSSKRSYKRLVPRSSSVQVNKG